MNKIWYVTVVAVLNFLVKSNAAAETILHQNGDDLYLSCEVTSGTVKWLVNGEQKDQTSSHGIGSKVNSTLVRTNISSENAGTYKCLKQSDDSEINTFDVIIISIVGQNISLVENSTAEFTCSVQNQDIQVSSLEWTRKGDVINVTDKFSVTSFNGSSTLVIKDPGTADAGLYICVVRVEDESRIFERAFSLNTPAKVGEIEKLRSKVEGEDAKIECKVSGFPTPDIVWYLQLEGESERHVVKYDDRVNTTANSDNVPNAILIVRKLKIKTDRGDYTCVATNSLGSGNHTATLKVKDKLAAVWPFLGICAEVAILCSIIFIFEKRRNRRMEEEEEVDAVKQDMLNQPNGTIEDKEIRQRNNAAAATKA